MTQKDVKAYMLNETSGTKKILYIIPKQIDATWVWYDRYNGYGKAATSKESAKNIVENEIIPNCKRAHDGLKSLKRMPNGTEYKTVITRKED